MLCSGYFDPLDRKARSTLSDCAMKFVRLLSEFVERLTNKENKVVAHMSGFKNIVVKTKLAIQEKG